MRPKSWLNRCLLCSYGAKVSVTDIFFPLLIYKVKAIWSFFTTSNGLQGLWEVYMCQNNQRALWKYSKISGYGCTTLNVWKTIEFVL